MLAMSDAYYAAMSDLERMNVIIKCWALAEKRAKHLCAFETLGLNYRVRRPSQVEVRKAWHKLCIRLHPDKHSRTELGELASEATRCLNLAKEYLFDELFGNADERVKRKYEKRPPVVVPEDGTTGDSPTEDQNTDNANKRPKAKAPASGASSSDTAEQPAQAGEAKIPVIATADADVVAAEATAGVEIATTT